jgi:hypothetical protein
MALGAQRFLRTIPVYAKNMPSCSPNRIDRKQGQAEIAETAIGRYVKENDRVKVVCMPEHKASLVLDKLPQ